MSIRSSKFFLLSLSGALLLAACSQPGTPPEIKVPPVVTVQTVQVAGVVSLSRAGEAVAGATVSVEGEATKSTTDASGRYALAIPVTGSKYRNLLITKPDYASTRVENVDISAPQVLDEILRRSFDPALPSTPPTVTTDLADGATVGDKDLAIKVTTVTALPDVNGPATGIASVGAEAGNSGYLNNGRTRSLISQLTGSDTFTFKAADLAAFKGDTDIHINIYDYNGNRTHLIRHVKVASAAAAGALIAPTNLAPLAITFADTATYGALSQNPQTADAISAWVKTGDVAKLRALNQASTQASLPQLLTPQAANAGTVTWVDVNFAYDPAVAQPRSFELYRSLDGKKTYSKVLSAAPTRVLKDAKKPETGLFLMRDNSAQLTPGTEVSYKVRAVSDAGSQDSEAISVTPLGRYSIELGAPNQAATGVDTQPIFRWKTSGGSDKEALLLLLLDRTQAEGKPVQWQSDVSDSSSVIYNANGLALTPYLQPFHAYDWQLAGVTYNTAKTAYSVGADYFNVLGVTANPVKSGPINEFVTGGY